MQMNWRIILVFSAVSGFAVPATAQNAKPPAEAQPVQELPSTELTVEVVQTRQKRVQESKELEEAIRTSLLETYDKALQQLKLAEDFSLKAAMFAKAIQDAPEQLKQLKAEQPAVPAEKVPEIPKDSPLSQLQQSLTQAEAQLAETQKRLTDLQNEPKRRADRRIEIPKLQDAARQQLVEIEKQLALKPPADQAVEIATANRTLLEARKKAVDQELRMYDQELRAYEATGELLTARRDQAVVQAAQADQAVKVWRSAVNDQRRIEAEKQAREARRAALKAHPAIKRLASQNEVLTEQRTKLAGKIEQVTKESESLETTLARIDAQFATVTDRVKKVGLTEAIGLLLRKQRDDLPDIGEHEDAIAHRSAEISQVNLELVDLEEQRALLADVDAQTEQVVSEISDSVRSLELPLVEDDVRTMLQTKRGYLDSLIADTNSYLDKLVEVDTRERQLIAKARDYAAFGREYILWIRSTGVPRLADFMQMGHALRWLASREEWKRMGYIVLKDASDNSVAYLLVLLFLCLLVGMRRRWKQRLRSVGRDAERGFSTSFRPTAVALLLTALASITWPAALWLAGYRLAEIGDRADLSGAVAQALQACALVLLTLEVARHVCRPQGLGESHFGWPHSRLREIRRTLRWLMLVGLPATFIVCVTEAQTNENFKNSLGRGAFLVAQALIAWTAHRVWRSPSSSPGESAKREGDDLWWRLRQACHFLTVVAPVALAALAIGGYYYTAVQLESRLVVTIWLALGLVIVHATLLRGLLLAYRDLAIRRARERRAVEAAAAAAGGSTIPEKPEPAPTVKLSDINLQTRKLVRLALLAALFGGTWLLWIDVLPALTMLRRVELWPHPFTVLDAVAARDVAAGTLTLGDGVLALFTALITLAASRNIPGLLEITVLRRLTLDAGARYAITAVCRYLITVAGIAMAFGQLGIGWAQVQWLVAAVSVGLGFGMQEIFANFVSGLILLFERPIRIGDIVSVGEVTGKVTRIRIRATTITDWDMRELVVPNKEFITGRVMNWTLTDSIARMTIKVGVAYGTDPDLVKRILLRVADRHPNVLKEPAPHALFDQFGDSTLDFTLRVYLPSMDVFLGLRHDLNAGIAEAFREAGIEIAFPQRDLHIRTVPEAVEFEFHAPRGQRIE
jgi:potassium-dependent mechanosensitive channel